MSNNVRWPRDGSFIAQTLLLGLMKRLLLALQGKQEHECKPPSAWMIFTATSAYLA